MEESDLSSVADGRVAGDDLVRRQNTQARSHAEEQLPFKDNGKPWKDLRQEVHDVI